MAAPEIERIDAVVDEVVEVAGPVGLVVEEGEIFGGVEVVVLGALVGDLGLLHAERVTA